jgi:hypothetical protein
MVTSRSAKIANRDWRRAFVEAVPENARTLRARGNGAPDKRQDRG